MDDSVLLRPSMQILDSKIVAAAILPRFAAEDGLVTPEIIKFYTQIDQAATIIVGQFALSEDCVCDKGVPILSTSIKHKKALRLLRNSLKASKVLLQLNHAGRNVKLGASDKTRAISPINSPISSQHEKPLPFNEADLNRICEDIKRLSHIVYECDYDGISLNFAHNFLFADIISVLDDNLAWLDILVKLVADLRATHPEKILSIKLTINSEAEVIDFCESIKYFDEYIDFFEISYGPINTRVALPSKPPRSLIEYIHRCGIRREKIMFTGGFRELDTINEALSVCSLIGIGRPFIYDPEVINTLKSGEILKAGPTFPSLALSYLLRRDSIHKSLFVASQFDYETAEENIRHKIYDEALVFDLSLHLIIAKVIRIYGTVLNQSC